MQGCTKVKKMFLALVCVMLLAFGLLWVAKTISVPNLAPLQYLELG